MFLIEWKIGFSGMGAFNQVVNFLEFSRKMKEFWAESANHLPRKPYRKCHQIRGGLLSLADRIFFISTGEPF